MRFIFLFFAITMQKKKNSKAEIANRINMEQLQNTLLDRQCSVYRTI
ncbi:YrzI family small protein [Bacillus sp. 165]|nr:YrzI family small protein [Bacillus sp. 165]MBO9128609.1 YrzI family small protein [Bacillus sp. 165]